MDVDLLLRRAQPPEEPWMTSLEEPFPGQDTSSSEEESRTRVMKLVERILAVDKPRRITGMMAEDPSQGKIPELRSIHMFPSNSTPSSAGSTSNVPLLRNRDDILIDSINPHDQGLDNDRDFVHPPDPTQHFHQLVSLFPYVFLFSVSVQQENLQNFFRVFFFFYLPFLMGDLTHFYTIAADNFQ
jgi:hypothetical protein